MSDGPPLSARLNPHLHLHLVVLDGLFARDTTASSPGTRTAPSLSIASGDSTRTPPAPSPPSPRTGCCGSSSAASSSTPPTGQPSRRKADARLLYRTNRPLPDGRSALRLTPLDLLARPARLIPPPRAHRHRYYGVLAPNARLRPDVVRYGRPDHELRRLDDLQGAARTATGDRPTRTPFPARMRWAQLLARVYELDPLRCPGCDGTLRILARAVGAAPRRRGICRGPCS
ncbi:MAG: transposase [Phycisphaerales bacterium JB038]